MKSIAAILFFSALITLCVARPFKPFKNGLKVHVEYTPIEHSMSYVEHEWTVVFHNTNSHDVKVCVNYDEVMI